MTEAMMISATDLTAERDTEQAGPLPVIENDGLRRNYIAEQVFLIIVFLCRIRRTSRIIRPTDAFCEGTSQFKLIKVTFDPHHL
jgi:hypothetical protein